MILYNGYNLLKDILKTMMSWLFQGQRKTIILVAKVARLFRSCLSSDIDGYKAPVGLGICLYVGSEKASFLLINFSKFSS